jgi:hypothetical protein
LYCRCGALVIEAGVECYCLDEVTLLHE